MRTKINLNDMIQFRLNREHPYYKELKKKISYYEKPDGYYHMPLWYMIEDLGPHLGNGFAALEDNSFTIVR